MIQKKICLLGTSGVGKTSLIARLVDDSFSDRYLTSVGVAIKKKAVQVEGNEVSLTIWDLAGDDKFRPLESSYLRGLGGYMMVADGTRGGTLDHVLELRTRHADVLANVPSSLVLLNKADLEPEWEIDQARLDALAAAGFTIIKTSAKEGTGVQEAFLQLARRMVQPA
jgi:small GTP-binding protein